MGIKTEKTKTEIHWIDEDTGTVLASLYPVYAVRDGVSLKQQVHGDKNKALMAAKLLAKANYKKLQR